MKKLFVVAVLLIVTAFSLFADKAPFDKVRVSESLILSEEEIQQIIDDSKVLDLADLERKLLSFNRWNSGVTLTTTLNPGKAKPGTTDIDIQVNETSPNSGYFSFDNYATESAGSFRSGFHVALKQFTAGVYVSYGSKSFYADYNFPVFGKKIRP